MQLCLVQWQISPPTSFMTVMVTDSYFYFYFYDFHLTTSTLVVWTSYLHHTCCTICWGMFMGSVFCVHRNQKTVHNSSLDHLLSTVTIFQVTLCHQYIPCTSEYTCHLVDGACINTWQNSSLQSFVLQEYNCETYILAYTPHINRASTYTSRYN